MKKLLAIIFIVAILMFSLCSEATEVAQDDGNAYFDDTTDLENSSESSAFEDITIKGKILETGEPYIEADEYTGEETTYQDVKVKINKDQRFGGTTFDVKYCMSMYIGNDLVSDKLSIGDDVYVYLNLENGEICSEPYIQYIDKQNLIIWIIVIYSLAILVIGGIKGLKALISLIITILAIFLIMIPQIYNGADAIFVTILTAVGVTIMTLLIVSGFSKKTCAAIIGTSAGVIVAGLFAIIFGNLMKLTGVSEHSLMLTTIEDGARFNFKGLMFSGMIVGALGACMDVGMSIASSIQEIKDKNPNLSTGDLIKSGMNIGKDIMGTMTNTLILAYVGSSLTLILLFIGFDFKLFEVLNQETIATEILRAIAGSFGIVFTIPLTTVISAILMGRKED